MMWWANLTHWSLMTPHGIIRTWSALTHKQLKIHGCISSYCCPGAQAPSHQHPEWLNIHYIWLVLYRNITEKTQPVVLRLIQTAACLSNLGKKNNPVVKVNSLRPSDGYMHHQWTRPSLVPIMACGLFGVKPLSEPMLGYCYTPRFNEVERGVYWYHLVRPSVRPSDRCPSVRLWTESCPLCVFKNTHRIHFIFAHLIKQLQKVCRM